MSFGGARELPTFVRDSCVPLHEAQNTLGEGAFWDAAGRRLLWVDIVQAKVFVQSGPAYETYVLPVMPSAIWKLSRDRVYLATDEGVGQLDLSSGAYRTTVRIEAGRADTRSNDGAMARDGSFWFGTMLRHPATKGGQLYRVSEDLAVDVVDGPVGIPNTFLFPSGSRYALIGDSFDRRIYRYSIRGRKAEREAVWLEKPASAAGDPDGSVLVDDRAVINAEWDSGQLVAYDLRGNAYDGFSLPVSRPTSCALGGGDGRTLYVTSARDGLSGPRLAREPLAGAVFAIRLNQAFGIEQGYGTAG